MADNATLPATGTIVRAVQKGGSGGPESQVVILDVGGSGAEALLSSANPMPTSWTQTLDPTNDYVRVRPVSGLIDDGSGNALTVKSAVGSASSSGVNAVVAAVTSKRIRVLAFSMQAASANGATVAANFQDDAGTPVVLSQTWELAALDSASKSFAGSGFYFQTTSGQALKLNLGGAQTVRWEVQYIEA